MFLMLVFLVKDQTLCALNNSQRNKLYGEVWESDASLGGPYFVHVRKFMLLFLARVSTFSFSERIQSFLAQSTGLTVCVLGISGSPKEKEPQNSSYAVRRWCCL
jgi:hypothetical protein